MASLMYLEHSFDVSDEELAVRLSNNIVWQYFSGMEYYEHRLPCDATQIGRFGESQSPRCELVEDGLELLFKATIDTPVAIGAVKPKDLQRLIGDTTAQEKAIAHSVDSRVLEIARYREVRAAKRAGIQLRQTFAKESRRLRWKAGDYAHAKRSRRLRRVLKRQRSDRSKLYALHAPEVECIGKGKARKPCEFGVKNAVVVSHKDGLMLGARTFAANPCDGHILSAVLE